MLRILHARPALEGRAPPSLPFPTPGQRAANCKNSGDRRGIAAARLGTLDEQAAALGLSRSTTWTLLQDMHKGSGLSARIIARMLSMPDLPLALRAKLLEYLAEKMAGQYGDTERELRRFARRLSLYRTVHRTNNHGRNSGGC